jgi:hypothetical protein
MPPTRSSDIHAAGAAASIVSFLTWILGHYVFHSAAVPPEVTGILVLTVPYVLSVGASYAVRRGRLRAARDAAYLASLKPVQAPPVAPPTGQPPAK